MLFGTYSSYALNEQFFSEKNIVKVLMTLAIGILCRGERVETNKTSLKFSNWQFLWQEHETWLLSRLLQLTERCKLSKWRSFQNNIQIEQIVNILNENQMRLISKFLAFAATCNRSTQKSIKSYIRVMWNNYPIIYNKYIMCVSD